ncbi:Fe-S cluster assembly protein SufD [Candidatus Pelagibacter sp. Uisw_127]|uniref:Fe-S cluster assembly protein SufD n=1 Tax=Candidatus Pelagibacter sp. Uisw_127 TaxID=3230988 RepID=UPI0039E8CE54
MMEQLKIDFDRVIEGLKLSEESIDSRKKNFNQFMVNGFPNKRVEDWKFSDLNQIISSNIKNLRFHNDLELDEIDESIFIDKFAHNKIIFLNGVISKVDFSFEDDSKVLITSDLNQNKNSKEVNPLVSLNNALIASYIGVTVKESYSLNKPLIIYNITTKELKSTAINLKTDIVLEKNSSLKLINLFDDNSENNFINTVQNFDIAQEAILKNYKIDHKKNSNIKYSYNNINLEKNSISENFIFSTGSKFIKNEINCNLNDEYSSAFINGIINLTNSQHHEIKTNINHLAENTKSYQLIKSVLNDNAKGIYQGKIYVDSKAQKTNGYQLSKAILLNENTEFDGKPELEIYADDVKCSHGATSGNLDEDAIFYLMSRGLSQQQSKELLINGFLLDAVEKITDSEIKDLIKDMIGITE